MSRPGYLKPARELIEAPIAEDAIVEALCEGRPFTILGTTQAASLRLNHAFEEFWKHLMEPISPMLEWLLDALQQLLSRPGSKG